jgi:hypothetical protein
MIENFEYKGRTLRRGIDATATQRAEPFARPATLSE